MKDGVIGIYSYDKYELCEGIFESYVQLAEYLDCSLNRVRSLVSCVKKHKIEYVLIRGRRKLIEFISLN